MRRFISRYNVVQRVQRGFSLGEVILASFILTIGIITVVKLVADSYRSSENTQDAIIAAELAQEGVELVRNIRDNQIAKKVTDIEDNGSSTLDVLGFLPNNDHTCIVDYRIVDANNDGDMVDGGEGFDCGGNPDAGLSLISEFYAHGAGSASGFFRRIKVSHSLGTDSARVLSFVTWDGSISAAVNTGNISAAINACTLANHCVYTELLLTAWK